MYLLNSIEIPQGVNKMFEHTITMQKKHHLILNFLLVDKYC